MCSGCKRVRDKDMADSNPLELVSQITEINDLHEFMEDDDVDRVLHLVVKLLMNKGNVSPALAPKLIVELQTLATMFAIKATYYQSIGKGGTKEAHKKNVYFTLKDAISKLVDALKYTAKVDH